MARKKKPEEHAHGESWLVSYCDMISLLVTFFLMMMTFSSKSSGDLERIGAAILEGGGGPFDGTPTQPMGEKLDRDEVQDLAEDLRRFLEARGVDESGTIRPSADGLSIAFDVDSSFPADSAVPTKALVANLEELSPILARWSRLVIVEGFVEGDFAPSTKHADVDSLGLDRAAAAAEILFASSALPRSRVQIASQGTSRPRAVESSAIGLASNRRVEIKIVSLAPNREPLRPKG
jgi:chemotaxis protein MotB